MIKTDIDNLESLYESLLVLENDSDDSYRGDHTAPMRDSGSPLHDLTDTYPDDIYSDKGVRYYGDRIPEDGRSIAVIRLSRNKPNRRITIYRAIPDFNYDVNKQIKALSDIIVYRNKFNFFPMNNEIVDELKEKYPIDTHGYDGQQTKIIEDIVNQINELESQVQKNPEINVGDWVTINKQYAINHGKSTLNGKYKIISKIVNASDIYTNGDSIHEWGYDPT